MVLVPMLFRPLAMCPRAGLCRRILTVLESFEMLDRCRSDIPPREQHLGDISVRDTNLASCLSLEQLGKRFARAGVPVKEVTGQGSVVNRPDSNVAAIVEGPFDEFFYAITSPLAFGMEW